MNPPAAFINMSVNVATVEYKQKKTGAGGNYSFASGFGATDDNQNGMG